MLTPAEREAINTGPWFNSLSPSLRHDILRQTTVKRLRDGALIYARGDEPHRWYACAQGAVRMSSTSLSGRQTTLAYVEPGAWFGAMSVFLDEPRTRDAHAHGDTTLLCLDKDRFHALLTAHTGFYDALLRLQARRIRQTYSLVEDLNTLPLRARLAKQLLHLSRSYGTHTLDDPRELRIGLQLVQEELAQLLGASRQRVNQELKRMERDHCIRVDPQGLVIRDLAALQSIVREASLAGA
ncbi:Global nitrogen regulator [Delftia tsuruhatensis]|uniref:Crp/Fnr family transcriptional regulator n=1 Tax=Delftia tsuruhatensis TaxID=180282 RepID=UPI001E70AE28|nr:Crp/Fnr family transcriptional regulator [Delftia tsuruhatensis]CAB5660368.1 Global nitrogen regulator [Delftia tsuruhatensis]CAC9679855.1 Global nitrogen regulator [Delftia tsuruhatensis]